MSINAVNNERSTWGAAEYSAKAASFGAVNAGAGFEEAMKSSVGFGSRSEEGAVSGSIALSTGEGVDLVSQLQFAFLKNQSANSGLGDRLNNNLF